MKTEKTQSFWYLAAIGDLNDIILALTTLPQTELRDRIMRRVQDILSHDADDLVELEHQVNSAAYDAANHV